MFARALLTAFLGAAAVFAAVLPSNSTLEKRSTVETISNCKVSGQVAITFDGARNPFWIATVYPDTLCADGPYTWETDIRNTFAGSKGTLFLNGNNWGCIYDRADE